MELGKEIVLAAGAINSPQILLLSGVGDADDLRRLSIPVVAHLPGVGRGLKDHVAAPVQYRATKDVSVANKLTRLGRYRIALEWFLTKKGLGATNFFEVGAFLRTDDTIQVPNVQIEFVPLLGELQHGSVALENGFQYFLSLMRPESEGRVWIDTPDPLAAPKFVFNYLAAEEDRRQAVAAVRAVREMVAQRGWDDVPRRGSDAGPVGTRRRGDRGVPAPAGRNQLPSLLHLPHGLRRPGRGRRSGARARAGQCPRRRRFHLAPDRQRQPERSGDHAGREARGHDPERAAAAAGPGSVLSRLNQQNEWLAS